MNDRRLVVALLLLALLSAGCSKKNARTTPTPTPAPPPPVAAPAAPKAVTPPPPPPARDPLSGDLDAVNRYVQEQGLLRDVLFDYDRHELRPDALRQLEANARFLKENPQFVVMLEGHCDERGTIEYNLALGQKRAGSARYYLDSAGIVRDRLQASTYGKERPICTERDESCRQRNRRVHFEIIGRTQ